MLQKPRHLNKRTVVELMHLVVPDLPIVIAAFACGGVAALLMAMVTYYTGQIIDYASIDPNR